MARRRVGRWRSAQGWHRSGRASTSPRGSFRGPDRRTRLGRSMLTMCATPRRRGRRAPRTLAAKYSPAPGPTARRCRPRWPGRGGRGRPGARRCRRVQRAGLRLHPVLVAAYVPSDQRLTWLAISASGREAAPGHPPTGASRARPGLPVPLASQPRSISANVSFTGPAVRDRRSRRRRRRPTPASSRAPATPA